MALWFLKKNVLYPTWQAGYTQVNKCLSGFFFFTFKKIAMIVTLETRLKLPGELFACKNSNVQVNVLFA